MIRKFGRLKPPPELVRSIFFDAAAWPMWQAGVHTATVLDQTETTVEVEVDGRYMGHRMYGVFDCQLESDGFFQHLRTGWLKRWDTHWRFLVPPDGCGTTLVCEVEFDLGLLEKFVPSSFIRRFFNRVFAETIHNINARAAEITASAAPDPSPARDGGAVTLLEVFETPVGFELLVGDRRINLGSKD